MSLYLSLSPCKGSLLPGAEESFLNKQELSAPVEITVTKGLLPVCTVRLPFHQEQCTCFLLCVALL